MQLYMPTTERSPFGTVIGIGAAFFPPGVMIPGAEGLDVFDGLMESLELLGIYTPWATRMGSMDWSLVSQPPDTNIAVGKLDDALYQKTLSIGFGAPLPFVGVHTKSLPTPAQIEDAFVGTPYSLYETQAVYSQEDRDEPPKITFLHWMQVRTQTDTDAGSGSLAGAAGKIGGQLVAMMQVGYTSTKSRDVPLESFESAFETQFAPPTVEEGEAVTPITDTDLSVPEETKPAFGYYQMAVAGAISVACGVAAYVAIRAITDQQPKRRVVSSSRAIVRRR